MDPVLIIAYVLGAVAAVFLIIWSFYVAKAVIFYPYGELFRSIGSTAKDIIHFFKKTPKQQLFLGTLYVFLTSFPIIYAFPAFLSYADASSELGDTGFWVLASGIAVLLANITIASKANFFKFSVAGPLILYPAISFGILLFSTNSLHDALVYEGATIYLGVLLLVIFEVVKEFTQGLLEVGFKWVFLLVASIYTMILIIPFYTAYIVLQFTLGYSPISQSTLLLVAVIAVLGAFQASLKLKPVLKFTLLHWK